jgi:alpha/beta hydrolase family protein
VKELEMVSQPYRRARRLWFITTLSVLVTGCGSTGSTIAPTPSDPPIFTSPVDDPGDPESEPVIDGLFSIGADGQLALRCWGEGRPVIVLEAGTDSAGIEQFSTTLIPSLRERNMACTYDRLGTGQSDPPPDRRRTLDDLVSALHEVLQTAGVPGPYLLVGSSGGGMVVVHYAGRYRREVAGLVLLDVGAPVPDLAKEFPDEAGWNNVESMDWFAAERQLALHRLPVEEIVVRIVSATSGDSDLPDESVWLELSPLARETTLEGGHVIYRDNPEGVVGEIQSALKEVTGDQ